MTIAECFLAADNAISAEHYVGKASQSVASVPAKEWALVLRFKSTQAKILDSQRKFLQAGDFYYALSQTKEKGIVEQDLLLLLGKAVTCTILGSAGQQRQRLLTLVANDERLPGLDSIKSYEAHSAVARKMFRLEIIQCQEMASFEASLEAHQKAKMADGMTIVQRVVMEHNLLAVQRVYDSIRIQMLAQILETDTKQALLITAKMIVSGAILGTIDQVEGIVKFDNQQTRMQVWNGVISRTCWTMNEVEHALNSSKESSSNSTSAMAT